MPGHASAQQPATVDTIMTLTRDNHNYTTTISDHNCDLTRIHTAQEMTHPAQSIPRRGRLCQKSRTVCLCCPGRCCQGMACRRRMYLFGRSTVRRPECTACCQSRTAQRLRQGMVAAPVQTSETRPCRLVRACIHHQSTCRRIGDSHTALLENAVQR